MRSAATRSAPAARPGCATSCRGETDARIEEYIGGIRQQLRSHGDAHRDQGRGLQYLNVAEVGGVEQHAAKTTILKEHFDDHDLREQPVEFEKDERDRHDQ